jgi:hypothetical protein
MNRLVFAILLAAALQPLSGQAGFIDKTGKVVIEPRFAQVSSFSEGLAPVRVGTLCGYIDREGREQIPPRFEDARRFREGRAAVRVGGKWGFIDREGKWVVEPAYVEVSSFSEGLAAVAVPIVQSQEPILGPSLASIRPKKEWNAMVGSVAVGVEIQTSPAKPGQTRAVAKGGWGYLNTTGKLVIPHQYFEACDFSQGLAVVRGRGGEEIQLADGEAPPLKSRAWDLLFERFALQDGIIVEAAGYIDRTGAMAIPARYSTALPFREGLAYADQFSLVRDNPRGYIDTSGQMVIRLDRYAIRPGGGGLVLLMDSLLPLSEFVPASGQSYVKWRLVGPRSGLGAMGHKEGLALAEVGTGTIHMAKWAFVDTRGKVVIENIHEFSASFSEGLAAVRPKASLFKPRGGDVGYVDRTGKLVIPHQFKEAGSFSEGLAHVQVGKLWGYIDPTGKIVIAPRFVEVGAFSEGLAKVGIPK